MEELFPNHTADNKTTKSKYIITDGGTGTSLEEKYKLSLKSKLWSSELIIEQPELLSQLHRDWEDAGAQIISTATYQATLENFKSVLKSTKTDDENKNSKTYDKKEGEGEETSKKCMRSSVEIVKSGINRTAEKSRISLSLGPYGATMTPSEDYTGNYFPNSSQDNLSKQEDFLMEFHLNRLKIFLYDHDNDDDVNDRFKTWNNIDLVLFETIPNLIEARAIRRAWKKLEKEIYFNHHSTTTTTTNTTNNEMKDKEKISTKSVPEETPNLIKTGSTNHSCPRNTFKNRKPFVISFVFPGPNGEFPRGEKASQVLKTALEIGEQDDALSRPDGIGINCTKLEHLDKILEAWSEMKDVLDLSKTWLWIYPDGGPTYDPLTKSWSSNDPSLPPHQWANQLVQVSLKFSHHWAGLVLGGCCNTSPTHIHELYKLANP